VPNSARAEHPLAGRAVDRLLGSPATSMAMPAAAPNRIVARDRWAISGGVTWLARHVT
jgi:hypothetical protein